MPISSEVLWQNQWRSAIEEKGAFAPLDFFKKGAKIKKHQQKINFRPQNVDFAPPIWNFSFFAPPEKQVALRHWTECWYWWIQNLLVRFKAFIFSRLKFIVSELNRITNIGRYLNVFFVRVTDIARLKNFFVANIHAMLIEQCYCKIAK
jgi:hypothetical protein